MRKLILWSAALLAASACAEPALASGKGADAAKPPCDARYYSDLVGQNIDAARTISGNNYRLVRAGADRGKTDERRMTIVYDQSNRIVEVACG
jgi:hypothetical protein